MTRSWRLSTDGDDEDESLNKFHARDWKLRAPPPVEESANEEVVPDCPDSEKSHVVYTDEGNLWFTTMETEDRILDVDPKKLHGTAEWEGAALCSVPSHYTLSQLEVEEEFREGILRP
eukprot:s5676_g1.t1